jgi:hypothetical protein
VGAVVIATGSGAGAAGSNTGAAGSETGAAGSNTGAAGATDGCSGTWGTGAAVMAASGEGVVAGWFSPSVGGFDTLGLL